jgi:hypothetical protein
MVKFTSIIPAVLAVSSVLAIPADLTETGAQRHKLTRRQINIVGQFAKPLLNRKILQIDSWTDSDLKLSAQGGKVPDPPGATSKFVEMASRVKNNPAARTVKVRYGPYKVPNMRVKNIMGEEGTLWNYPDNWVKKPCDECYIVGMNAGLEWPNGENANINRGMWLHHVSLVSDCYMDILIDA